MNALSKYPIIQRRPSGERTTMNAPGNMYRSTFDKLARKVGPEYAATLDYQFLGYTSDMKPIFRSMAGAQNTSDDKVAIRAKGKDKNGTHEVSGFAPNKW